jgi:hypothetical protein
MVDERNINAVISAGTNACYAGDLKLLTLTHYLRKRLTSQIINSTTTMMMMKAA